MNVFEPISTLLKNGKHQCKQGSIRLMCALFSPFKSAEFILRCNLEGAISKCLMTINANAMYMVQRLERSALKKRWLLLPVIGSASVMVPINVTRRHYGIEERKNIVRLIGNRCAQHT